MDSQERQQEIEVSAFTLGGEECGINIPEVREIGGRDTVTRTANAPDFIKSAVNLGGTIVPIADMRIQFNLSRPTYDVGLTDRPAT